MHYSTTSARDSLWSKVRSTNFLKQSQPPNCNVMKKIYTPTKEKKILLVDDYAVVAAIYQNKLQSERFKVEVANRPGLPRILPPT